MHIYICTHAIIIKKIFFFCNNCSNHICTRDGDMRSFHNDETIIHEIKKQQQQFLHIHSVFLQHCMLLYYTILFVLQMTTTARSERRNCKKGKYCSLLYSLMHARTRVLYIFSSHMNFVFHSKRNGYDCRCCCNFSGISNKLLV